MNIRPVSDLRNKFPEVESQLKESGSICLTKNGYGVAVLMDMDEYTSIVKEKPVKPKADRKTIASGRGFFHKYANPDLIPSEKDAKRIHILKKYGFEVDK